MWYFLSMPITQKNSLGINFPITHTSVTQKNCFRIICAIMSGLIVSVCQSKLTEFDAELTEFASAAQHSLSSDFETVLLKQYSARFLKRAILQKGGFGECTL